MLVMMPFFIVLRFVNFSIKLYKVLKIPKRGTVIHLLKKMLKSRIRVHEEGMG